VIAIGALGGSIFIRERFAARLLGISRRQLFDKIQQYGLQP